MFVDNLSYPQRIEKIKIDLYKLKSPNQLKRGFSSFIAKVEEQTKMSVEQILNESLAQVFVQDHAKYITKSCSRYIPKKERFIKSDALSK